MRLVSAKKFVQERKIYFQEFHRHNTPQYAILSHTWEEGQEVTYEDCKSLSTSCENKRGYEKISWTCRLAIEDGIEFVWIDTCCIDKSSSAELTEAINSMFQWYQRAVVCYAYLSDLDDTVDTMSFEDCRWFRRGWTLQELIAPRAIGFFNYTWDLIGSKDSLLADLSKITRIDTGILDHSRPLSSACVAKRFSWAANRETTREEDIAYCLLGIFNVNMPMLYGEGENAFRRLQEEVIRSTYDLSIFAWSCRNEQQQQYCGFLARSPNSFSSLSSMYLTTDPFEDEGEMIITNKGIQIKAGCFVISRRNGEVCYALGLDCAVADAPEQYLFVPMRKTGPGIYARTSLSESDYFALGCTISSWKHLSTVVLLTTLPSNLSMRPPRAPIQDMVSTVRFAVVEIKLVSDFVHQNPGPLPERYWDAQDSAFFSTRRSLDNWGAYTMRFENCTIMFLCYWYKEHSEWVFEGTMFSLDRKSLYAVLKDLYIIEQGPHQGPSIVKELTNYHGIGYKTEIWTETTQGNASKTSFTVERADDSQICSGPRWIVRITAEQGRV
ncbi:hypothetical protein FZEAL_2019 [Fusarium zealandicum]|uniref:Heterokaryon incompatibility domain-containing protein n=1 Tax=Fusarium zealandicum TaxID=1053134 RepID=A0A8H4URL7_9HYPO|nr:hypothetical protein FZEAL_2019 [Fusarium zealandicum]